MLVKELYNLNAAPIVNTIFSLKWSEDDHISMVTENGVHTFELVPIPTCSKRILQFYRSYIYPSDTLPTEKYTEEINNHVLNWEREQVYTLLLEEALSPKPNKANATIPRIIDVAWSPKGLVQPGKCMLATLTSVGAVDIAIKIKREWFSIHDLSGLWLKHLEDSMVSGKEDNYAMYVAKARRLQATAFAWSNLEQKPGKTFAYFAIAYRSSELVIWQIEQINNSTDHDMAQIVYKSDLNCDVRVKVMTWIKVSDNYYFLFIGYHDGRIQCLQINRDLEADCLNIQSSEECLLESDRIPISSISLLNKCEDKVEVIVTKGHFLLYLHLDTKGCLKKSFSYRNPGIQISGTTPINASQVLTFSEDGKLTLVSVLSEEVQGRQITNEMVTNRLRCLGLSGSTNKCLFATITSPNSVYDHLVIREPSTIHFFYINDERKDPFSILLNENVGSNIGKYWDCLEILRMKAIDNEKYCHMLYTRNDLECMSFGYLRTTMWINIIKQTCYKNEISTNQSSYNINEAKSLIFLHSAVNIINQLTKKLQLSEEELTIMGLLKIYLEIYIGINDTGTLITKKIQESLMKISNLPLAKGEACGVCQRPVCDSSSTSSLCPIGHKLPRCSLTLMQITTIKFKICPVCNLIFHLVVDTIWEEPKCLYCDVDLVYDSRICRIKCTGNIKNLSKSSSTLLKEVNAGENNGMDEEEGDGEI